MKTTLPSIIFGGIMALTLSACNTMPMNGNGATGSSNAGMTSSSDPAKGDTDINARGAVAVNCATNVASDGSNAVNNPGTRCPTESH